MEGPRLDDDLAAHVEAVSGTVAHQSAVIAEIVQRLTATFRGGGKLLVCGNGGSAADAQHLVAEVMNRMRVDHAPWPAIALSTDTSVMTSIANDARYDDVFARQVEALGKPGDMLIGLSTSGTSPNVVAALQAGRRHGMVTVLFTGRSGGAAAVGLCDLVLAVPSDDTARIQESHEFVYHFIADSVEATMLGLPGAAATAHRSQDG